MQLSLIILVFKNYFLYNYTTTKIDAQNQAPTNFQDIFWRL